MRRTWAGLFVVAVVAVLMAQGGKIPADEMTMSAQAFTPVLTLEAQSNLVEVPVVVRDVDDRAVGGLAASNFTLSVDGKAQAISSFAVESGPAAEGVVGTQPGAVSVDRAPALAAAPPPHVVAFYFDDLNSNIFDLGSARMKAERYLAGGLEPNTRVAVFTHTGANMLNLTTDLSQVKAVLARIQPVPSQGIDAACPIPPALAYNYAVLNDRDAINEAVTEIQICTCGSTKNHCAAFEAGKVKDTIGSAWDTYEAQADATLQTLESVVRYLGKQPGTRTLILSSSGVMTQTLGPRLQELTDAALRARVIIDTVDAKGLVAPTAGENDKYVGFEVWTANEGLQRIADDTGGRFYHDRNDLDRAYKEFTGTPETSYLLAFTPAKTATDGAFHSIAVTVHDAGTVNVQSRAGFYDPAPALPATDLGRQQMLNQEVFAQDALTAIPAVMRVMPVAGGLRLAVAVDPQGLRFSKADGRSVEKMTFVAALLDAQGKFVTGSQGVMDLKLKPATLAAVSKPGTGITTGMALTAPAGEYTLRVLVEESHQGQWATFTQAVEVH